jgi:hypothetical protein
MDYNLEIVTKEEAKEYFGKCIAGGFCDPDDNYKTIKLFIDKDCDDIENTTIEIINHEVLHHVLSKVAGEQANWQLDNVNQSFYVYDFAIKKWCFAVRFLLKSKETKTLVIA